MEAHSSIRCALLLGALLGPALPAHSLDLLYELTGAPPGSGFGSSISGVGDLDGDGHPDILVGAPLDSSNGFQAGSAYVFSGRTGALVHVLCGEHVGDRFGSAVCSPGDLDGDGWPDLLVAAPEADPFGPASGSVYAVSGMTGQTLYRVDGDWQDFRFATSLAALGDVDGDGVRDWAAGAPGDVSAGSGSIRVHSGATGAFLYAVFSASLTGSYSEIYPPLGERIVSIASADSDSIREIALVYTFGLAQPGTVAVLSGVDGTILATHSLSAAGNTLLLSDAGDVNADGGGEIAVRYNGRWEVRDGVSWALISSYDFPSGEGPWYTPMEGAGDRDGDGVPELLYPDPFYNGIAGTESGRVLIFDAATGALEQTVEGLEAGETLGRTVAFVGDLDGDGLDDFAARALPSNGQDVVRVFGGCDLPAPVNYCTTSPNSVGAGAVIGFLGPVSVAQNAFVLTVSGCVPGQHGVFFYGPDQVQVPFGNGVRCVGGGFAGLFRLEVTQADANGDAAYAVDFTRPPANQGPGAITAGSTWNFQFWYRDPAAGGAGYDLSDGLQVTFCP